MDDLNSQQIVLLTLLVSFITSIATGITTVALLEQAPEPVTQTINRVVEKTIERVITEPAENTETIIEREVVTVVVNEEDLTIDAVDKNAKSLVRIYSESGDLKSFVSIGVIFNQSGEFVTDSGKISDRLDYVAVYSSGEFPVQIVRYEAEEKFATFSISEDSELVNPRNFSAANFIDSDGLKLGQSVISISGEKQNSVSTGIINEIKSSEDGSLSHLNTSVVPEKVLIGSIILNLQGEIAGMKINDLSGPASFVPANIIRQFLSEMDLVFDQQIIADDSEAVE